MKRLRFLLPLAAVVAACGPSPDSHPTVEEAVRQIDAEYCWCLRDKDRGAFDAKYPDGLDGCIQSSVDSLPPESLRSPGNCTHALVDQCTDRATDHCTRSHWAVDLCDGCSLPLPGYPGNP